MTRMLCIIAPGVVLLLLSCQPKPPPLAPPPAPLAPSEPEIAEVVKNQLDLSDSSVDPCTIFQSASEAIWSYQIQSDLNLAVNIYEGRLAAGDAEILVNSMDAYAKAWRDRFARLCADRNGDRVLAEGQFESGVSCLRAALTRQKDYVNRLFHEGVFKLPEEDLPLALVTSCDETLAPAGDRALRDNPF